MEEQDTMEVLSPSLTIFYLIWFFVYKKEIWFFRYVQFVA